MKTKNRVSLQNIIISLIIGGVLVLALGGYLSPLTRLVTKPYLATQTWFAERTRAAIDFFTSPRDLATLRQQNADLASQVSQLESQLITQQQQLSDVQILEALLDFSRAHPENRYLAAEVIGRDPSPFLHYILINRGSDDGLIRGMPVANAQGLVGRITAVTADAARVELINDPSAQVNVRIQPAGAEGLVIGSLTGDLSVAQISQQAKIQPGDVVLTSGLGGNFPPNILIGQITGIHKLDFELFQQASLQPAVDFSKLDIVLVITNFHPIDIAPLINTPAP